MIRAFQDISEDKSFQQSTRNEARLLMDSFLKVETILISFVFLRIYKITTTLSLYLQTKGLDMLQAWRVEELVAYQINEISRDFEEVHEKAKAFCTDVNEALEDTDLDVASYLPKKRARKTPWRAGEQCHDQRVSGELEEFKVNTFNVVMDRIVENLKIRFRKPKQLYEYFACFDPRWFPEPRKEGVPEKALEKISEILGDSEERPCGRNWKVLWKPFQDSSGPFLKNLKLQRFLRRMRMRTRLPQKCGQIEDADPASRVPIKFYIITVSTVQHTQNYIYSLSLLVDVCHHPGRMWTFFFKTEAHKDQATNYSYTREPGMLHADGNRKWHFK